MKILGLHRDPWHNTGATILFQNDKQTSRFDLLNVEEERLNRVKDTRSFPEKSIKACLDYANLAHINEIDFVILDYIIKPSLTDDYFRVKSKAETLLEEVDEEKLVFINHHLAHAAAAFYSSPFPEAAILVVDGRGSQKETQSLFFGNTDGITLLKTTSKIGIGLLYAAVTQAIGFSMLQEGKTMGLAPFGADVNEPVLHLPEKYNGIVTDFSEVCVEDNYELRGNNVNFKTEQEKARAAYEVQKACENSMLHLARYAKEQTSSDYLCISGGVALNSVANYKIHLSNIFKEIFINPAASDSGISLGCALYGHHTKGQKANQSKVLSPFLGPAYTMEDEKRAIENSSKKFLVVEENIEEITAYLLHLNFIVACCRGRSEMGPRALGARSILMNPSEAKNKDMLNHNVKNRESFRPFAPAILEEYRNEYFKCDVNSPFMLFVPEVLLEKRLTIPAVTHVDGTARLQTVSKSDNFKFYELIRLFHNRSGVPILLNTSFNVAGEPIVENPEDALRCFSATKIDALLFENYLLVKEHVKKALEASGNALK